MIKKLLLYSCLFLFSLTVKAQNTVGVMLNSEYAAEGYTLFTAHTKTFLINNCGEVIKQWNSAYTYGNSVYLLENGNLLRAGNTGTTDIFFGGQGGVVEIFNWEGNLIWQFFYDTPQYRQHHDIYPMPNGNILILAAKVMSNAEAIQAGRNPAMLLQGTLYSEEVFEIEPTGTSTGNIVWSWDIKNHLVQDFDASKSNYGIVSDNPNKLDINFTNGMAGNSNWLHVNSIQYNPVLDQIVLSSRNLSEFWIIDHSTTTAEAATSAGGNYNKGGDILYRWGNPQAYKRGTEADRKLFGQHYVDWIDQGLQDEGKIILFNNGNGREPQFSEVYIMTPPSTAPGEYILEPGTTTTYGPVAPDYIYSDTSSNPSVFNSSILSSAQRLPNGNILICEGIKGNFFEIDSEENIVWRYLSPVNSINGTIASQGGNPPAGPQVFRATKYAPDYIGLEGKNLIAGSPIELNSAANVACSDLNTIEHTLSDFKLSPNPTSSIVRIETKSEIHKIEVYNILGSKMNTIINSKTVDLSGLESGIYLIKMFSEEAVVTKKVIKQ
ncbi:aryl-sulfate sulfotransferase [Flavobacterium sp. PLA-1-15]|uniref:aryl-sulfate sulfotransferase n=1 Tax=Flavobacterium sp. PLA-1-15 TaxID=3380533 RepID=UPI003B761070